MTSQPFRPSTEEIKHFVAAVLVTGAAFAAYSGVEQISSGIFFLGVAGMIILTRELGQRIVAYWMDADIEMDISLQGSLLTAFGAFIAIVTSLPFILLFPVYNRYSIEAYEQWGKSVDAIWLRREFWLASGGIFLMFLGWMINYWIGNIQIAIAFSLFILFQLLPFDYKSIPTGRLDGSIVLKQNGFIWLIYIAVAWSTLALVWV